MQRSKGQELMPGTPTRAVPDVEGEGEEPTEPRGGGGQPQGTGLSKEAPLSVVTHTLFLPRGSLQLGSDPSLPSCSLKCKDYENNVIITEINLNEAYEE